ncbi:TonB-dependent receptor plug domain-containing protein, partial [Pseudopedobacter sp.]|uniref:TonB-dependent receptor plug domain-containing protein n=1 Tax=Pseudopedobacter sp. TaxID=1936787 RepID=UPI0033411F39
MMSNLFFKWANPRLFLTPMTGLCVIILVLIAMFNNEAFSQASNSSVIGKITDSEGRGIPGVEIYVKESAKSTLSQKGGLYNLNLDKSDSTIVFSKLGYIKQELSIGNKKVINVKLKTESSLFNEVVNIGYGAKPYQEVAGALTTAKPEDFIKAPVGNFDDALSGRMAGVKITSLTGQPGENADVVIRGANSLYKDYSPLYVIDGVVVENIGNVTINPEEIASVSVLKDASLTSIYGSRGANGVLIINTKRGHVGKVQISLNSTVGFQQFTNKMEMMNPYDFVKYQTEINAQEANELYSRASLDPSDP